MYAASHFCRLSVFAVRKHPDLMTFFKPPACLLTHSCRRWVIYSSSATTPALRLVIDLSLMKTSTLCGCVVACLQTFSHWRLDPFPPHFETKCLDETSSAEERVRRGKRRSVLMCQGSVPPPFFSCELQALAQSCMKLSWNLPSRPRKSKPCGHPAGSRLCRGFRAISEHRTIEIWKNGFPRLPLTSWQLPLVKELLPISFL